MDVGHGDATWIVTGQGHRILVDAGRSRRVIEPHLWEGPDTLDLLVASHNHVDHIGGLPWVFDRFVVRRYLHNGLPHRSVAYDSVMASARREPGLQFIAAPDTTLQLGNLRLRILPADRGDPDQNDNSVGVLIEFGEFRALLSGDSPRPLQDRWVAEGRIPKLHVLKAAHHGASDGWSADLARVARPDVVVFSYGEGNGYGHPNPRVVRTWLGMGARVLSTAERGDVIIRAKLDGTFEVVDSMVLRAPIRAP